MGPTVNSRRTWNSNPPIPVSHPCLLNTPDPDLVLEILPVLPRRGSIPIWDCGSMYQSPDSGRQYDLLFPPYPRSSDTRRRGLLNLSGGLCSCVVGVSVPLDKFSWPKPRCLSCHLLSFLPHLLNPTLHVRSMSPFAIAWAQLPALVSCADVGLGILWACRSNMRHRRCGSCSCPISLLS